ncbi:uncharacterized protein LOC113782254 [Coffea eugenioides]|uniref:uncharacterized protein LOC113782254 n=2 Tax=Coffea eugenioides TaxID=49369 RepID=UPI000F615613|nr:uncharacterized protein LOC113782254 [Coffea eugenioides]
MHSRKNWDKASSSSASDQFINTVKGSNGSETGNSIYEGNEKYYSGDNIVRCYCQEQCRIVTAWTEANPSRRFHGCRNYGKRGACRFFLWYDPPIPQKMKNIMGALLRDLRSVERENAALLIEMNKLKAKVKILFIICICFGVLLVFVLGGKERKKQGLLELKMLQFTNSSNSFPRSESLNEKLDHVVDDLLEKVEASKVKIGEDFIDWAKHSLEPNNAMSGEVLVEFFDCALVNLKDLLKFEDNLILSLKEQISTFEVNLRFLRNFVIFTNRLCSGYENIGLFFTSIEDAANNGISFWCWVGWKK